MLRGGNHFSDSAQRLILGAIRRVKCIPSRHTHSVHSSSAGAINLLIPSLHGPCFTSLISSVRSRLCTQNCSALVNASTRAIRHRSTFVNGLLKRHVSKTVIIPRNIGSPNVRSLVTHRLPLIFISHLMSKMGSIPFMISSPCPNIYRTITRLIHLKRHRVKFISRSSLNSSGVGRHRTTFHSTITRIARLKRKATTIISYSSACISHRTKLGRLMETNIATVVYTCSPSVVAVVNLLRSHNVSVNDRVSIVSFSSVTMFHLLAPRITVVSRRTRSVNHRNISVLLSVVVGGSYDHNRSYCIPSSFMLHSSIKTPV